MDSQLLNYGIGGVALLFTIKELFAYLKIKKNGSSSIDKQILDVMKDQNNNHLHTIQESMKVISKDINAGNSRVVDAIKDMHTDLAGKLGELKGKLDK